MTLSPFILKGNSLDKILHYKFWTSLNVSWFPSSQADLTIVTRLLNENPLLEELDMFVVLSNIDDFSDLFKALVKSRLKSLKIETSDGNWTLDFSRVYIELISASFAELPFNETVENLAVNSKSSAEFSSLFVKYFRNVRDLSVRPGNVNNVLKFQVCMNS